MISLRSGFSPTFLSGMVLGIMVVFLEKKYTAFIGAIICTALWGTAFPFIKLGYESLSITESDLGSKLLFAGERFALAGVLVFVASLFLIKKSAIPKKTDIAPILVLGFVQTTLQYLFSYVGVGFTKATNTSVISGTASLISVILAGIFLRSDELTPMKITGCIVGFSGIFFVNAGDLNFGSFTFLGDFLILLSAFCGAGGNIITKKIAPNRNPFMLTAFQLFVGGVLLMLFGIFAGGKTSFVNIKSVGILIWLSFVSAISFLLWTILLRYHPVSRISIFNMLIPIFGTLWSGVLLGEEIIKWQNFVSLILISAGIILVNIRKKQEKQDGN